MGCMNSKEDDNFRTVDDSVHTGIKLAKKKQEAKGEAVGYKPRPAHPMLEQHRSEKESQSERHDGEEEEEDGGPATTATTTASQ